MRSLPFRFLFLAALGALAAGCLEADMNAEIKEDGSGTLGVSMKFSEKMVEILSKAKKEGAPKGVKMEGDLDDVFMYEKPDDAVRAEMEKAGLKLLEMDARKSDKEAYCRVKFQFTRIAALQEANRIESKTRKAKRGGGDVAPLRLTRDKDGVYTLLMDTESTTPPKGKPEEKPKPAAAEEEKAKTPEEAQKEMEDAMKLMGELMGEMAKFKLVVSLAVPGEVVDFAPTTAAKRDGGKVTWTFDIGAMMAMSMEQVMKGMKEGAEPAGGAKKGDNPFGDGFRVRFRMPEGKSLPESALWSGPPKATETPAPKAPEPPKKGEEAPPPAEPR